MVLYGYCLLMCLIWVDEIEDKKSSGADMSPAYLGECISGGVLFTVFNYFYCSLLFLITFTLLYCSLLFLSRVLHITRCHNIKKTPGHKSWGIIYFESFCDVPNCISNYLFENCGARRAAFKPYFFLSFILGSLVR